jgi:hypothetical protein
MTIGGGLGPERLLRTNIRCTRELQACHDKIVLPCRLGCHCRDAAVRGGRDGW